jgi:outer membrane protein assembly factor BamB
MLESTMGGYRPLKQSQRSCVAMGVLRSSGKPSRFWSLLLAAGAAVASLSAASAHAGNWPQWRGPDGNSVAPKSETNLPLFWSEQRGVRWKTVLPEWGNSTPAIWGDAIFLTSHHDDKLLAIKLSKKTGEIVWTRELGQGVAKREGEKREQKFHRLHNLASPSPVTDGEVVVFHFGSGDLAALDFDGNILWQRNLEKDYGTYTIWWGHANSPVLYRDLVISVCMQDSLADVNEKPSPSYLVAHRKTTGKEVWRSDRMTKAEAEQCDSYTTPVFYQSPQRLEMIVMGANQLDAYDPATGKQLWYLPGLVGGRTITGPTVAGGMVYTTQGMRGPLLAVKLGGEGELTRQAIAWKQEQGTPDSCSPVVWGNLAFVVSDNGVAKCFDAVTGHLQWEKRLGGDFKASPLAAEGRIYFLNREGLCTIVSAAPRFDKLSENKLDDETLASPAVSDGLLFVRGHKHLYCLEKK